MSAKGGPQLYFFTLAIFYLGCEWGENNGWLVLLVHAGVHPFFFVDSGPFIIATFENPHIL